MKKLEEYMKVVYVILFYLLILLYFAGAWYIGTQSNTGTIDSVIQILQIIPRIVFLAVLFWPFTDGKSKYWPPMYSILCINQNGDQKSNILQFVGLLVLALAIGISPKISF
ncbi:MAG: hypothetical protein Ta2B_01080 [Termitinemataceae bacterium]|nr:MAG: hypothetical protein Ta2B_01080 [Termitinemataceae bacterium]